MDNDINDYRGLAGVTGLVGKKRSIGEVVKRYLGLAPDANPPGSPMVLRGTLIIIVIVLGLSSLFIGGVWWFIITFRGPLQFSKTAADQMIMLNPLVELDFKSKEDVYALRSKYVAQHADLLIGTYKPSVNVFGQIESGKQWWGINGQFCSGPGEHSSDGPSEEARFIVNPFLLLGIDEDVSFIVDKPCTPIYPEPREFSWNAQKQSARVSYNLTSFYSAKKSARVQIIGTFLLENLNARDFGFNYVYIEPTLTHNVAPFANGMFNQATPLRSFLHVGGSCGLSGGCNNRSPSQPELYFKVTALPATLSAGLWKDKPKNTFQPPDFTFTVNMY